MKKTVYIKAVVFLMHILSFSIKIAYNTHLTKIEQQILTIYEIIYHPVLHSFE